VSAPERPTVTFDPSDDATPFVLNVEIAQVGVRPAQVNYGLTRSELHAFKQDIETAEQEDRQASLCLGDHHVAGQLLDASDRKRLLPAGDRMFRCRNCPATFVLEADGDQVPVGEVSG
jgi:hypothetical protein